MRRLDLLRAFALLAMPVLLAAAPPSLTGAVYRGTSGTTSTSIVGALVYVHASSADPTTWTGPIVTDSYGRFAFAGLTPGKYVLRIYVSRKRVWEQVVTVPGTLPPIVLSASAS
jgi:hypothetical protein